MKQAHQSASAVRFVTVDVDQDGQRIDNFLLRHMKGVPKSHIYRILRKGEVRVNKGRIRAGYRLKIGDRVRIPPVRRGEQGASREPPKALAQQLGSRIFLEEDDFLVLDKPAGLAVHAGSGVEFGVIEVLRALRPQASFLELVHRLDRETSGCLLLAKNRQALLALQSQLKDGTMTKRYLTLVQGRWQGGNTTVSAPLRRNVLRGGERMVQVADDGRQARTEFQVVAGYGETATLMDVRLGTGRTHQIRVHAAHVGHPLAGDDKYGSTDFNQAMKALGLTRLFLHAHYLGFRRPGTGEEMAASTPLSDDLQQVLDRLETQ